MWPGLDPIKEVHDLLGASLNLIVFDIWNYVTYILSLNSILTLVLSILMPIKHKKIIEGATGIYKKENRAVEFFGFIQYIPEVCMHVAV